MMGVELGKGPPIDYIYIYFFSIAASSVIVLKSFKMSLIMKLFRKATCNLLKF